ncbi:MAG: hypothetical protein R3B82_03025 [Sandaracinaceae bacterium]
MDEIVKQVSAKTGLSEEQSRVAVSLVIAWVKTKLPEGIRGQVDGFLAGGAGAGAGGGDLASMASGALGGLLGKKD